MAVVTFLNYADFLEEITQTILVGPVRVQDYVQTTQDSKLAPLAHHAAFINVAAETPEDVLLCRFKIGYTQTLGDHDPDGPKRLRQIEDRANLLAERLRASLANSGLSTGKGLIAISQPIHAVCTWPDWFNDDPSEAAA